LDVVELKRLAKMLKKIICSLFLASLSLIAFGQNDPNMRDRMEQRIDGRSNGDMRQDAGGDRAKNIDDTKRDGAVKGITKDGFAVCAGEFAICASSTCKPTGKTISVKEDGGKTTKQYPEAVCKCPVVTPSIANQNNAALVGLAGLNEGDMDGSCRAPGAGKVWSFFSLDIHTYPQEQPDGSFMQPTTATNQNCSAKGPAQGSNCWSYICTVDPKKTNGVKTATCRCPYGEGGLGQKAKSDRGYITFAGGTWNDPAAACKMLPVGFPDQLLQ
jgi:hypothetical protein